MGQAIGEVLPLAIGIAISPIPIIAIILMLLTPDARRNGLAFLGGWVLGLAVVGAIVLIVANVVGVSSSEGASRTASLIRLLLGIVLLVAAWRRWTKRPHPGDQPSLPGWMRSLEKFTPQRALAVGALLSGVNPKNLVLNVSAAAGIAQAALSGVQQAVVLVVLVLVGSVGVAAPVVVYLTMHDTADRVLAGWRTWLADNNATVMVVLFLVFGVVLVGKGIGGL